MLKVFVNPNNSDIEFNNQAGEENVFFSTKNV